MARKLFVTELLTELARSEARVLDRPFDEEDLPYARERLWDEPGVRAALDGLWPLLTPQQLLAGLLGSAQAIRSAAGSVLDHPERYACLHARPPPSRWTVADVPLLDEAAELLGVDDSEQRGGAPRAGARAAPRGEVRRRGARRSRTSPTSAWSTPETLAAWNRDNGPALATAERAAADRSWAYGHVIIDEAQELSAMAWRMVLRRNPARSMTVVGDVAQTGSPAGATSWKEMLDPAGRAAAGARSG